MWTIKDAAEAWGISESRARRIVTRIKGAYKIIEGGNVVWQIPENTPRPIRPAGRPKKKS